MAITNQNKPSTSLVNTTKVSFGLTWGADLNQWQNELQTWGETISIIDNSSKPTTSFTNISKPA